MSPPPLPTEERSQRFFIDHHQAGVGGGRGEGGGSGRRGRGRLGAGRLGAFVNTGCFLKGEFYLFVEAEGFFGVLGGKLFGLNGGGALLGGILWACRCQLHRSWLRDRRSTPGPVLVHISPGDISRALRLPVPLQCLSSKSTYFP